MSKTRLVILYKRNDLCLQGDLPYLQMKLPYNSCYEVEDLINILVYFHTQLRDEILKYWEAVLSSLEGAVIAT